MQQTSIYTDGTYLRLTRGEWGRANGPLKAGWILRMLKMHPEIYVHRICEIGCGVGAILHELRSKLPSSELRGYEISPQAHELSLSFADARCQFICGSAFDDNEKFDLVLALDVAEHVEDCFAFLRQTREKGRFQIYHIPIEAHVSAILRGSNAWDTVGHIHLFTLETAIRTLQHTGHRIIDSFVTDGILKSPYRNLKSRIANVARAPLGIINKKLAARLLGGYSLLVLTEALDTTRV